MVFKEMNDESQFAFTRLCGALMFNANTDRLFEMSAIFADCLIESIASEKGITDCREYPELAAMISHAIENSLRDYIEYHIDQEYGPDEEESEDKNEENAT